MNCSKFLNDGLRLKYLGVCGSGKVEEDSKAKAAYFPATLSIRSSFIFGLPKNITGSGYGGRKR